MGVLATVRDVAIRAGVSVGTVSNALNEPEVVSEDTVARVMEAVRQLRLGESRAIGMILLDMRNPFFAALALGAETGRAGSATRWCSATATSRATGRLPVSTPSRSSDSGAS